MKRRYSILALGVIFVAGCSSGGMSQDELNSVKTSPAMTDADRKKVADGMAKGAQDAKAQETAWAKAHPEEAAKKNAQRASHGLPPLGG